MLGCLVCICVFGGVVGFGCYWYLVWCVYCCDVVVWY